MKRFFCQYAWIGMILIFLFGIHFAIKSVEVYGAGYNGTMLSETAYNACFEYGEKYGICPELLIAIAEQESSGNPKATNGGCKGLMQIYEKYHKDRMKKLGVTDLFDERSNILVATDYISELTEDYEDAADLLAVYNGDRRAGQVFTEYAQEILERSAELERANGK